MKKNKRTSLLSMPGGIVAFLILSMSVLAEEKPLIVSFQSNPKALASSDFVKRLTALPEWEPFFQTFTNACDQALTKELSAETLHSFLPGEMADDLRQCLNRGVESRRLIEGIFGHTETILFELRNGDSLSGLLVFLTDQNPRAGLIALKYAREGKDYDYLKNEPDGDFMIRFHFTLHGRSIAFLAAGLKLSEKRYAVLFSNDDGLSAHCRTDGKNRFISMDSSTPLKKLTLEEECFRFFEKQRKRFDSDVSGSDFFGKIKKLDVLFHDVAGVSQIELSVEMRTTEDAKAIESLFAGLVALIQLNRKPDDPIGHWLQAFQFRLDGDRVFLSAKLDDPELWKLIGRGLDKATREIKRRSFSDLSNAACQ